MRLLLIAWVFGAFLGSSLLAENRKVVVMPTIDSTNYGLTDSLQYGLGVLYQDTKRFDVFSSTTGVQGFTPDAISAAFLAAPGDLLSFVYLEESRISVFLFDRTRPNEFIVAFQGLEEPSGGPLSSEFVETQFRVAFGEMMAGYDQNNFQKLPGSDIAGQKIARSEEAYRKAEDSRKLFRELSAIEDSPYYMGAGIGMSRFAAAGNSASTVNLGAAMGYRWNSEWSAEMGVDLFSYAAIHAGPRYLIPLTGRYVSARAGLDVGTVAARITENRGFSSSSIPTGSFLFGPALSVDIPLLGATLRADVRMYFGDATVLLGTYGIVYNL